MVDTHLPRCLADIVYSYYDPWRDAGTSGYIRTLNRLVRPDWDYCDDCYRDISIIDGLMTEWGFGFEKIYYEHLLRRFVTIILSVCIINPIDYKIFIARYRDSIIKGHYRSVIRDHNHAMRQATRVRC